MSTQSVAISIERVEVGTQSVERDTEMVAISTKTVAVGTNLVEKGTDSVEVSTGTVEKGLKRYQLVPFQTFFSFKTKFYFV